jgi:hypothetical protein
MKSKIVIDAMFHHQSSHWKSLSRERNSAQHLSRVMTGTDSKHKHFPMPLSFFNALFLLFHSAEKIFLLSFASTVDSFAGTFTRFSISCEVLVRFKGVSEEILSATALNLICRVGRGETFSPSIALSKHFPSYF